MTHSPMKTGLISGSVLATITLVYAVSNGAYAQDHQAAASATQGSQSATTATPVPPQARPSRRVSVPKVEGGGARDAVRGPGQQLPPRHVELSPNECAQLGGILIGGDNQCGSANRALDGLVCRTQDVTPPGTPARYRYSCITSL
jgi:hypothetical protein